MQRKESIGKDATSKDTLEDLEANEVTDDLDDDDLLSPDGELDDADELEDADPV